MKLKQFGQSSSFFRFKCFVKRRGIMGVEIVRHDPNFLGFREIHTGHLLQPMSKIFLRPLRRDFDHPPTCFRLEHEKEVATPAAFVLVVLPSLPSWFARQRWRGVRKQLVRLFVHADRGEGGFVRLAVQRHHVLHTPEKIASYLRDAPRGDFPRLELVFFSVVRMVS